MPVITIQYRGRKNALGWFSDHRWGNSQEDTLSEINICAETLARSVHDIAETLIHEMVHYANALDGISDCTIRQYHNEPHPVLRFDGSALCRDSVDGIA